MHRGHVTGNKKERTGSQDWYTAIAAEHLARIEAEWVAKQAEATPLEVLSDGQLSLLTTEGA